MKIALNVIKTSRVIKSFAKCVKMGTQSRMDQSVFMISMRICVIIRLIIFQSYLEKKNADRVHKKLKIVYTAMVTGS